MISKTNQLGSTHLILLATIIVIVGLAAYFIFKPELPKTLNFSPSPQASPALQTNTNTAKQQLYEQNKEEIKADLDLSEEEFQILKRYSAD